MASRDGTRADDAQETGKPPARPGGRREAHRREREQALEDAALKLFLARGLDGVTIDDITQAAGVAKGTFYRYFDDKAALVDGLLEPVRRELLAGLETCGHSLAEARNVEAMFDAYRAVAAVIASALLQYPGVVRLYLQESRGPAVGARTKVAELARLVARHAVDITQKAHTSGLLRPIRPAVSGLAVVGAVERLLLAVLSEEDIGNPLELPDALTTLVLDGLRLPPEVRPRRRKLDGGPKRP
ncbi:MULTISPECIES: TetR/AcrR family transcriptional regulator [Myxococcus]|uniref:TetR family transcriptional regulator n=1 Tax=Myxococcus xanthus TaxID=34 RepID=A0AAE6KV84_MYXXA|nr:MULTISPECIES: TetR/AcrR family transcriptional regulator [Myxococcus]QDE71229.1 TetR family transcriptional regulator [Myxococcus xanthus]QDE78509.1 TetR family transcriptional regulator [Myxococcus xanthus]QDF07812.1 TetR family transcriptional regulator [Myxococcus xanthus]WAM25428.1 TetR/AcrR family transcriptional regulator [Myxococcus sp. NMCA1]